MKKRKKPKKKVGTAAKVGKFITEQPAKAKKYYGRYVKNDRPLYEKLTGPRIERETSFFEPPREEDFFPVILGGTSRKKRRKK